VSAARQGCKRPVKLNPTLGGAMASDRVCDVCGEQNPAGTTFCQFCGNYLGWDAVAEPEEPQRDEATTSQQSDARPSPVDAPTQQAAPPPEPPRADTPTTQHDGVPVASAEATPAAPSVAAPRDRTTGVLRAAESGVCPSCGRENEPTRTLCARCGYVLGPATTRAKPTVTRRRDTWWSRLFDPQDRAARRAFRHSLPAKYWWRRAIFALLGVLVVGGLAAFLLTRDPVQWASETWFDVRGITDEVPDVQAAASPPDSDKLDFEAGNAVDSDLDSAWATEWTNDTPNADECGDARGVGALELTFPAPVELRGLQLSAGLAEDDSDRLRHFRPQEIDVTTSDGTCSRLELQDTPGTQQLDLTRNVEVTGVTLTIASAYAPEGSQPSRDLVSIRDVEVRQRPR
jgi:hypothetical protein